MASEPAISTVTGVFQEGNQMATTVSCPHCKGLIVADPSIAGKNVGCPHCNGRVNMPVPTASPVVVVNKPSQFAFRPAWLS